MKSRPKIKKTLGNPQSSQRGSAGYGLAHNWGTRRKQKGAVLKYCSLLVFEYDAVVRQTSPAGSRYHKKRIQTYALEMESEIKTVITPYFKKYINEMGSPCFAEFSETITFAAAPIIVILPPRHAPSDKHHQRGKAYSVPIDFCISAIIGAIVAV